MRGAVLAVLLASSPALGDTGRPPPRDHSYYGFKPGAWTRTTLFTRWRGQEEYRCEIYTEILEVVPGRVRLEDRMWYRGNEFHRSRHDVLLDEKGRRPVAANEEAAVSVQYEWLTFGSRRWKCKRIETQMLLGDQFLRIIYWLHPDVPTGFVRTIVQGEDSEQVEELIDYSPR